MSSKHSPSPEFDDEDWQSVQDGAGIFVPLALLLGVAYAYGSAFGAHGVVAIMAGLVPAYVTGKVLGWLYRRVYDAVAGWRKTH